MRRFRTYTTVILITILAFSSLQYFTYRKFMRNLLPLNYTNTYEVLKNYPVMSRIVGQGNNLIVAGTKDLKRYNEKTYPTDIFNYGLSDFNYTLIGNPEETNLSNAISLGAYSKNYKNDQIILIIKLEIG